MSAGMTQDECPKGYKKTEVGVIPEDWEIQSLKEVAKVFSGYHVLAQHYNTDGEGIPYITGPSDFSKGVIQHTKFTTKPGTICKKNDILVTVKGSGVGTLILSDSEYCISRQLMAIRVAEWDVHYVYFSLLRDKLLLGAASAGLIPGLSRTDILSKLIIGPSTKAEQEAIAEALSDADALIESLEQLIATILTDIDNEINTLESKLSKARHIKQGMMQELLTGRIRLI